MRGWNRLWAASQNDEMVMDKRKWKGLKGRVRVPTREYEYVEKVMGDLP